MGAAVLLQRNRFQVVGETVKLKYSRTTLAMQYCGHIEQHSQTLTKLPPSRSWNIWQGTKRDRAQNP